MVAKSVLIDAIEELMERLRSTEADTALAPKVKDKLANMKDPLSKLLSEAREILLPTQEEQQDEKARDFGIWLELVDGVVDDLDYLLDELSTEAGRRQQMMDSQLIPDTISKSKVGNLFPWLSNPLTYCYHMKKKKKKNIESQIEEVSKRLLFLEDNMNLKGNKALMAILSRDFQKEKGSSKDVIGRKTEKQKIIKDILDSSSCNVNPQVIAVVGVEGIGKTTLAEQVYNDERVSNFHDLRLWADLSKTDCDVKFIVRDHSVKSEESTIEANDLDQIKERVQKRLLDRRWLLVLDGAVNVSYKAFSLPDLPQVLQGGRSGGKILITTRSMAVAKMATVPPFVLTGLPQRDAFSLFKKYAFPKKQTDPTKLFVGRYIVDLFEGNPGLILRAAHFLSDKLSSESEKEWFSFFFDIMLFGKSQLPSSANDVIFSPLKSKFDNLVSYLKHSLAYCSLLPRGHRMDVQMLCQLWMAQGFIKTVPHHLRRNKEEEMVYYSFIQNLLNDGFFQDVLDEFGIVRSCRMEDNMHTHAFNVAQGRIILMDPDGENMHPRVRHVTLDFNLDTSWQIPDSFLKAHRLRTILLSAQTRLPDEEKLSKSACDAIFSCFKRLRVLDLHDLGMKSVPNSLGKLKHLRYLDLSKNSFSALPGSTTSLLNLQTLKLSDCFKLKELPEGINMLVGLCHLEIDGCYALTRMPQGLRKLTSLQTLSSFVVNSDPSNFGGLVELNNLNNLRGELDISQLERLRLEHDTPDSKAEINSFLDQKQHLQRLTLRWEWNDDPYDDYYWLDNDGDYVEILLKYLQPHNNLKALSIMGFKGDLFSSWVFSLPHLVKLSLYNCPRCRFLPSLHKLTTLEILELERMEDLEYIADSEEFLSSSETPIPFFPFLKRATLCDCPSLICWWRKSSTATRPGTAVLPSKCIERLDVLYCPELTPVPFYPEELRLVSHSVNQLEQMMMKMAEPSLPSSSSSSPMDQGLKSLIIVKIEALTSLPEEWLKGFTSLQSLHIQDCHKLTSFSEGLQHLSSLQNLTIENCSELVLSKDEVEAMPWTGLTSLRSLTIKGIPKLKALPKGLSNATFLKELHLSSCPSLMSLPDWIGNPISLDKLQIVDCPKLLPRCQQETGEDWPKIARITNRSVK